MFWVVAGYFGLYLSVFLGIGIVNARDSAREVEFYLVLAAVSAVIGCGLLALRGWARNLAIAFLALASLLIAWWAAKMLREFEPPFIGFTWIVFNLMVVAYLLRKKTRDIFTPRSSGRSSS